MKKNIISIISILLTLIIVLGLISPLAAGIYLYISIFITLFIVSAIVASSLINLLLPDIKKTNKRIISIWIAVIPIAVLAFKSIGSFSLVEVLLTFSIPLTLLWYSLQRKFGQ